MKENILLYKKLSDNNLLLLLDNLDFAKNIYQNIDVV
jgi:hypothetical protein